VAAVWLTTGGCAVTGVSPVLERYRPDVSVTDRSAWQQAAGQDSLFTATNGSSATAAVRRLRIGDRVSISKCGIPQQEEIKDVIDDRGGVNLSLIGTVKIVGMTTSEAEEAIESAYVNGGYYSKITVVVVVQDDEYFVRGEVMRPGKYPLNPGVTLLRAITTAGGYTDFANARKINVFRRDKSFRYDAKKIEALEDRDPVIEPDDVIVVERRWSL
jgi:polysaccharide export outer membrane protein